MAARKENLKSLFTNTRSRVIIIFTALLLTVAVIVGFSKFFSATNLGPEASASLSTAPGNIQSIPGALNPTVQYAKLQEQQNLTQAKSALKTGTSAIPTIIRTQTLGEGIESVGSEQGRGGVGFATLAQQGQIGPQQSLWFQTLSNSNCSKDAVKQVVSEGATVKDLRQACSCLQLKDVGYQLKDLEPVCDCKELKAAGVSARELKEAGYSATRLRQCGYDACELRNAGFSAQELKDGGFSDGELKGAGYSDKEIARAGGIPDGLTADDIRKAGCGVEALRKLRAAGVTAAAIRRISGCTADQLRAAGYTDDELLKAGFTLAELKPITNKNEKCSVENLRAQRAKGVSATTIRQTLGCSLSALKAAGYTAKELKDAGFSAAELKNAGFTADQLKGAGFTAAELKNAGFSIPTPGSEVAGLAQPKIPEVQSALTGLPAATEQPALTAQQENAQQLQKILERQNRRLEDQRFQQQIQQRTSEMLSSANQDLQEWQKVAVQSYTSGKDEEEKNRAEEETGGLLGPVGQSNQATAQVTTQQGSNLNQSEQGLIKTGDIMFAVVDTSVNSDEPGPILATIVSGRFKGAKLIGSFNLPNNADKMVISFNTMSVPGAAKSTSISAVAIDPNTARTALSSRTDHHYLYRYGSLFAASFLEGFGNAFQSADTTVTVGGTGGGDNITVQNGINRSLLDNAIIGLATVGKQWSQVAQQQFNRPTTVEIFSGTPLGILFTQDLASL